MDSAPDPPVTTSNSVEIIIKELNGIAIRFESIKYTGINLK